MRLATMVQMLGVIVLALGLEQAFASIDEGDVLDNGVMVAGYVVMRVPMVFLWAARGAPRPGAAAGGDDVRLDDLGRAGLLGRARDRRPADRDDVRDRRRPHRHRDGRAVRRAAAEGRDAVARASHRRALRAARHHHARRGDHRHGRVDQRGRARLRRAGRSTPRSSRSRASASSSRRGGRTSRSRGPRCSQLHRERSFTWGYGHIVDLRRARGDRRGPARRRLLPRARDDARPDRHRAEHGDPGVDLRRRAVRRSTPRSPGTSTRSTSRCWRGPQA